MANPGDVTFSGNINGCTEQGGQIGPVDLALLLKGQKYQFEVKDWPIEAAAVLPGTPRVLTLPTIPAVGGLKQTLLVIKAGGAIQFTINGGATVHTLEPGGLYVIGGPDVATVEFGNPNTFEVKVYVLQVVGA